MKTISTMTLATALCALMLAVTATSAVAQSPSVEGYNETGISSIPSVDRAAAQAGPAPGAGSGRTKDKGTLPITGLGLPLLALLGGALLATGALMRRGVRPPVS